jgi:hypothetical protein
VVYRRTDRQTDRQTNISKTIYTLFFEGGHENYYKHVLFIKQFNYLLLSFGLKNSAVYLFLLPYFILLFRCSQGIYLTVPTLANGDFPTAPTLSKGISQPSPLYPRGFPPPSSSCPRGFTHRPTLAK